MQNVNNGNTTESYIHNHNLHRHEIKTEISKLVRTTRFWNSVHQVRSNCKDWKAK